MGSVDITTNNPIFAVVHGDSNVASSDEKVDENFAKYFFITKVKNNSFKVFKCKCLELLSKTLALRHFKVDPAV